MSELFVEGTLVPLLDPNVPTQFAYEYLLGCWYRDGLGEGCYGVPINISRSFKLFELSGNSGHPEALDQLARYYELDPPLEACQDKTKDERAQIAHTCWIRAAHLGSHSALDYILGLSEKATEEMNSVCLLNEDLLTKVQACQRAFKKMEKVTTQPEVEACQAQCREVRVCLAKVRASHSKEALPGHYQFIDALKDVTKDQSPRMLVGLLDSCERYKKNLDTSFGMKHYFPVLEENLEWVEYGLTIFSSPNPNISTYQAQGQESLKITSQALEEAHSEQSILVEKIVTSLTVATKNFLEESRIIQGKVQLQQTTLFKNYDSSIQRDVPPNKRETL